MSLAKLTYASPPTSETLALLLSQVSLKDHAAFAALYQATSLKLFSVVLRILKRKDVAEDILQDVYVKIWERAGDFSPLKGSAIAWMATIARNRALDEIRRSPHPISSQDMEGFEDIPSLQPSALHQLEQSEAYRKLAGCLEGIEPEKRKMILLAYQQGLSREFLAERFGQPLSTIKTWLRRTLQSLKHCMDS